MQKNPWIRHALQFQNAHKCTFRAALQNASATYRSTPPNRFALPRSPNSSPEASPRSPKASTSKASLPHSPKAQGSTRSDETEGGPFQAAKGRKRRKPTFGLEKEAQIIANQSENVNKEMCKLNKCKEHPYPCQHNAEDEHQSTYNRNCVHLLFQCIALRVDEFIQFSASDKEFIKNQKKTMDEYVKLLKADKEYVLTSVGQLVETSFKQINLREGKRNRSLQTIKTDLQKGRLNPSKLKELKVYKESKIRSNNDKTTDLQLIDNVLSAHGHVVAIQEMIAMLGECLIEKKKDGEVADKKASANTKKSLPQTPAKESSPAGSQAATPAHLSSPGGGITSALSKVGTGS